MTKTGAFACTFNQPRNISYNKALFGTDTHYAQMRMQRREGIVGNLGTCVAHGRNESRLSCVGHTEQADVGKHLELKAYCAVLPRLARRAWRGARLTLVLKCRLPKTALAACSQSCLSPWCVRSATVSPVVSSTMSVPTGMRSTMSSPPAPKQSAPRPFSPLGAKNLRV